MYFADVKIINMLGSYNSDIAFLLW